MCFFLIAQHTQKNSRVFVSGFTVEFEKVKNLPCGETHTFTVKFDAQGSSMKKGDVSVLMPIQVIA